MIPAEGTTSASSASFFLSLLPTWRLDFCQTLSRLLFHQIRLSLPSVLLYILVHHRSSSVTTSRPMGRAKILPRIHSITINWNGILLIIILPLYRIIILCYDRHHYLVA